MLKVTSKTFQKYFKTFKSMLLYRNASEKLILIGIPFEAIWDRIKQLLTKALKML